MSRLWVWSGFGVLLCASAEATPRVLSLQDAFKLADSQAPTVRFSEQRVAAVEQRRIGAGVFLPNNPRVYGEFRPAITGTTPWSGGFAANVEVPFDISGTPRKRVVEAEKEAGAASADSRLTKAEARFQIGSLYLQSRQCLAKLQVDLLGIETAERTFNAAKTRSAAGAAGDVDLESARAQLSEIQSVALETRAECGESELDLRQALDLPPEQTLEMVTEFATLPELPAPAGKDMDQLPQIAAITAQGDVLDAAYNRMMHERYPRMSLFAGVDAAPVSPIFGQVGLAVEIPVAQRSAGLRAQNRVERESESWRRDLTKRSIEREINARRSNYELRRAALQELDKNAIPAAERNLELIDKGWRLGRFDVFRLTTAAREVHRLRALRVAVLSAAWVERLALSRADGVWP
jgi:outer membrane protein TolC